MKNWLSILGLGVVLIFASCTEASPTDNGERNAAAQDPASEKLPIEIASGLQYKIELVDADPNIPRKEMTGTSNGLSVIINYGSPQVKERLIWDYLVPYDKVWECGGNGITTITFAQNCQVAGVPIQSGTYSLFVIPKKSQAWTIIINRDLRAQDASAYDPSQDVVRFQAMPYRQEDIQEILEYLVINDQVMMAWEAIRLPIAVLESP